MKKKQFCPDSIFSSSKMIIFTTEGQKLKHGWIEVLCSKTMFDIRVPLLSGAMRVFEL